MVEKIRLISNNNTKQKLIPDLTPVLKTYQDSKKKELINNFQKNIMFNLEKIWNYAKHRDKTGYQGIKQKTFQTRR
jgi:hypothetical protein